MEIDSDVSQENLYKVCERLGVEPGFDDYRGIHHVASSEVLSALIEALGYEAGDEATLSLAVEQKELESWREGIPPVAVLHEHWQKAIEIHVPESLITEKGHWEIRCETGKILQGSFVAKQLEELARQDVDGEQLYRYRLFFTNELPLGYHRLYVRFSDSCDLANKFCHLIVTPKKCYNPDVLESGKRLWGYSIQLYSLRSKENWGIGDFGDLKTLVRLAARQGAGFIGLNPLHALFITNPLHKSPYSPSSRLYLNYLYLDVSSIEDFSKSKKAQEWFAKPETQERLEILRQTDEVDYLSVARIKQEALELAYHFFLTHHAGKSTARSKRFKHYVKQQGDSLLQHAAFDALFAEQCQATGAHQAWQRWDKGITRPDSAAVAEYIKAKPERVQYFQYLQWLATEQLESTQQAARVAGMPVGLYRDFAVSVDAGGAETWGEQDNYSFKASVGAPPDPLALLGQDWGLPPLNPHALRRHAYSTFIKLLRANMSHTGALRIDHVMWLFRLWWIPQTLKANQAAYVYYPLDDLLGILALESQRNHCLVIGEDLGTVPEQIRTKLPEAAVYSYKVMYFEKTSPETFKLPTDYEPRAMATVSTHDLPTLAGWWNGTDLELRDKLGLFPNEEVRQREYLGREQDRKALLESLVEAELLPGSSLDNTGDEVSALELAKACHVYLARSKSSLMTVQIEDLMLMQQQVNLPGTTDEYPNWCRKLTLDLHDWAASPEIRDMLAAINVARKA